MNKQLIQEIINADNKDMDSVPVNYTVDSKYNHYYYDYNGLYDDNNGLYYDDNNHVEFVDDYEDEINLSYEDVIDIRVGID